MLVSQELKFRHPDGKIVVNLLSSIFNCIGTGGGGDGEAFCILERAAKVRQWCVHCSIVGLSLVFTVGMATPQIT